ncbi:MAG: hypothetical protein M3R04_10080 [bacterium]|nr:hypothetical protein [bacterium]
MRSRLATAAALLLLFPYAAHAAPAIEKIVNESIKAVQKTSYRAQLKFLSTMDNDAVREVRVVHLAPDLYRVEPLSGGRATGEYMIENASELMRISGSRMIELPRRQFAINDALTIKFLRDLGKHEGTTVLSGRVGNSEAWMLRHDMTLQKPYIITVGIDKKTWFPLFLLVIDGQGRARVYYEIEDIEYREAAELPDSLFQVPEATDSKRLPRAPEGGGMLMQPEGSNKPQPLPLFPAWLPSNYRVEAVSMLRCPGGVPEQDCALVYQFEAYGPQLDDMISIFQMEAGSEAKKSLSRLKVGKDSGYIVIEKNGWVIAVFGDLPQAQLKKIATKLESKPKSVEPLLQQTVVRDVIMDELRER